MANEYFTDDDLIYIPKIEGFEWIEWDDIEGAYIDNLGNIYHFLRR